MNAVPVPMLNLLTSLFNVQPNLYVHHLIYQSNSFAQEDTQLLPAVRLGFDPKPSPSNLGRSCSSLIDTVYVCR